MTELPIQAILLQILDTFDSIRLPYRIMGGFAVRAIGIPRPACDVDLTIEASDEVLGRLFDAFEKDGFIIPGEFRKGFKDSLLQSGRPRPARVTRRRAPTWRRSSGMRTPLPSSLRCR